MTDQRHWLTWDEAKSAWSAPSDPRPRSLTVWLPTGLTIRLDYQSGDQITHEGQSAPERP